MRRNAAATDASETRSSSTVVHSPPCSLIAACRSAAFAAVRVVSTTEKPSVANFCATAPPIPHRLPTGRSLSSTSPPWASSVLRPPACHFEVAPTTTAMGLLEVMADVGTSAQQTVPMRWRILLVAALAVASITSCGGDDDDDGGTATDAAIGGVAPRGGALAWPAPDADQVAGLTQK